MVALKVRPTGTLIIKIGMKQNFLAVQEFEENPFLLKAGNVILYARLLEVPQIRYAFPTNGLR